MQSPEHWSFKLAEPAAALPVGAFEHSEFALKCLGPISSLHREFDHPLRFCTCFRCASDGIQRLAVEYNSNRLLNKEAPRAKNVLDQADLVRRTADQLLNAILSLDDYSRKAFQDFGRSNAVADLPLPAGHFRSDPDPDPGPDSESLWVQNLTELRDAAKTVSDEFKRSRGAHNQEHADKGGNTNLFKEEHNSPDRNLVWSGWHLYEQFKPNQARGTEHGAFHEFLKSVFEYATAQDPEEYSSLFSWVKVLANPLRQKQEIFGRYLAVQDELAAIDVAPLAERSSARIDKLSVQHRAAEEELIKITLRLKHLRPGKKLSEHSTGS